MERERERESKGSILEGGRDRESDSLHLRMHTHTHVGANNVRTRVYLTNTRWRGVKRKATEVFNSACSSNASFIRKGRVFQ